MINYKTLELISLSPVESPLQAVGFLIPTRPSIRRPRHCAGSGLARKYKYGLGAHIEDGVATQIRPENNLQQLNFTEVSSSRHQRMGSETGYARLNVHPILQSASVCVYILLPFDYLIISLLLLDLHAFHFYFY